MPPSCLVRAVLRKAMGLLLSSMRDIDYVAVERAVRFLEKPSTGQVDLTQGLCLFCEGGNELAVGRLVIQRAGAPVPEAGWPRLDSSIEMDLALPGSIDLPAGWRISGEWVNLERPPDFRQSGSAWEAWLDAAALPDRITVRTSRPGDRFQPLGMRGHSMKLSDLGQ